MKKITVLFFNIIFLDDQSMVTIPIPAAGPKVTSMIWGTLDEKIITGHENGDIGELYESFVRKRALV